jgi:hypothetical protein
MIGETAATARRGRLVAVLGRELQREIAAEGVASHRDRRDAVDRRELLDHMFRVGRQP